MMNKSISPVATQGILPGVGTDATSKSNTDAEAGVSFSSLMESSGAAVTVPENSARPQADTEEPQQASPNQATAVVPGQESAIGNVMEVTGELQSSAEAGTETTGLPTVDAESAVALSGQPPLAESTLPTQEQAQAIPVLPADPVINTREPVATGAQQPTLAAVPPPAEMAGNNTAAGQSADPVTTVSANGPLPQAIVPQPPAAMAVAPATVKLPAGELQQNSVPGEMLASAVRAAMQIFSARAGSDGAQQSLAEGRNLQPDLNILATRTSVETLAISFTDTLAGTTLTPAASRVQVPVGQQGWGHALGERVMWFISKNVNSASLRLNPQHLGPLEMQVNMDGDKANVAFVSQHAIVREALDAAMPRLRELFAEQGLSLGDVNVSQHGASGQRGQNESGSAQLEGAAIDAGTADAPGIESGMTQGGAAGIGLVDYYV